MHTLSMALYFLNKKILGTLGLGDALSEVARWFPDFFLSWAPLVHSTTMLGCGRAKASQKIESNGSELSSFGARRATVLHV